MRRKGVRRLETAERTAERIEWENDTADESRNDPGIIQDRSAKINKIVASL
jgi:hypothetical protein